MSELNEGVISVETTKPKLSLLPMHLLFLAMAITFIILGSILQGWNFKIGILATEFGMLVLPASIFMLVKRQSIREQFKFKAPKPMDLLKVVIAGLCFVPVVGLLNSVINLWFVYGLKITPPQIPLEEGVLAPLITFLIAAATPGFCEEFFFRGMLLTEYEKRMSAFQAALVTAILFGVFHYNIMNFFGPIALGLMFAWLMQVTGSIWTAMLGHMVNNTFAVVMLYATANLDQSQNMETFAAFGQYWPLMIMVTLIVLSVVAFPLALVSFTMLKSIRNHHLKPDDVIHIGERIFMVHTVQGEAIQLFEETEGILSEEVIETTYKRLYNNVGVRLKTKHWNLRSEAFSFKLKEWWPILIALLMYIGVNILNIMAMLKEVQ